MLCDAHRPKDADTIGFRDHVRDLFQGFEGQSARLRCELHREWLQASLIILKSVHPLVQEASIGQTVFQQIASDGGEPDQVGCRLRMQEKVSAFRHLMFAQIGDDEFLTAQLVGLLYAGSQDRVALRRIAADDNYKAGVLNVLDGPRIATVTDRAKEAHSCRRLAVAGAIVHIVRADDRARKLLHEVAFLIGAFRRRDECERVRPCPLLDFRESPRHQVKGFLPTGRAKLASLANQRRGQPVGTVHKVPAELAFNAGGDAVGRTFGRLYLQDVSVFGPNIKAAADAAIGADGFGSADSRFTHGRFRLRNLQDCSIARVRLDAFYDIDHAVHRSLRQSGQETGVPDHGFFHERVTGADCHAMAARNAARFADGRSTVPQHARMGVLPADGERFIHLNILAGLDAAAAQNALIRIVSVERVRVIYFIRLGLERNILMLNCQHFRRVVDRTIPVVIVADRAVEHVVAEDPVESLPLRGVGPWGLGGNIHAGRNSGRACPDKLPVDLDHAGVACLNRAELGMITNVGNFGASSQ